MTDDAQSYVRWLRSTVTNQRAALSPLNFRKYLTNLIHTLEDGNQFINGALLPSSAMGSLQSLLPELFELLLAYGGPWIHEAKTPVWTKRDKAKSAQLRSQIEGLKKVARPPHFQNHTRLILSGLPAVGFAPNCELLLVVSNHGRGVFNSTGEKLARHDTADFDSARAGHQLGIGPLAGISVPIMNETNGVALKRTTPMGWRFDVLDPLTSEPKIWFAPPQVELDPPTSACVRLDLSLSGLRAIGYSDSGKSLVIVLYNDVHLFSH